jgi:pimeloyl-ACP methyl ester carboxylesterase
MARARRGYPDVDEHFLGAARSLMRMLARRSSYLSMMKAIRVPVLLLHGEKDRLVTIESARAAAAANPSWRFEVAADVGHVPQLEVPEWTAERILEWLADLPAGPRTDLRSPHTSGADTSGTDTTDPGDTNEERGATTWSS